MSHRTDQQPDAAGTVPDAAPRSVGSRLRFLASPRWIALIIGAVAFALACYLFLAPWQFGRNRQQSALNAQVASAIAAAPVPIDQLMSTTSQPAARAIWHSVRVTGTFDASREVYIRLRQDSQGDPASEVVVPLVLADGTAVLVDRGYVSFTSVQQKAPLRALPTGTVTVTGRVQADQTDPKHRPPVAAPDGRMQYTAVNSVLAGPGPTYRGYLQLTDTSPGVIVAIGLPQEDSGPFFSYALQWLSFGAIAVLGIGYFIYREFSDPVEEDIYLPDGDPRDDAEATAGEPGARAPAARSTAAATAIATGANSDLPDPGWPGSPSQGSVPAVPAATDRTADRAGSGRSARRSRGFDKSQLYDS